MISILNKIFQPSNAGAPLESMTPAAIASAENIPQLQFTERKKSREYISPSAIAASGKFDIYASSGIVTVLDDDLAPIREFETLGKPDRYQLYLDKQIQEVKKNANYIADNSSIAMEQTRGYANLVCFAKELPVQLQGIVNAIINSKSEHGHANYNDHNATINNTIAFNTPHYTDLETNCKINITPGGKYIIVSDTRGHFIAYGIVDDQERSLPPRQWKKYPQHMDIIYPNDLENYLRVINETPYSDVVFLEDKFAFISTDDDVRIIDVNRPPYEAPIFTDKTPSVGRNVCINPANNSIVYFCRGDNPTDLTAIDTSMPPEQWLSQSMRFPTNYDRIRKIQMDPTGSFFVLDIQIKSKDAEGTKDLYTPSIVFLNRDTLEEIHRLDHCKGAHFNADGRLRAINNIGQLVEYEGNLQEVGQAMTAKRVREATASFQVKNVLAEAGTSTTTVSADVAQRFAHLAGEKGRHEKEFQDLILQIRRLEDVQLVNAELDRLRQTYATADIPREGIDYVTSGIRAAINEKVVQLTQTKAVELLTRSGTKLMGSLSLTTAGEVRKDIDELEKLAGNLDRSSLEELNKLKERYSEQTTALFRQQTELVQSQISEITERVEKELLAMTSKGQFNEWREYNYPQIYESIVAITRDCPAEVTAVHQAAISARQKLLEISQREEQRFAKEYSRVREAAATRTDSAVVLARTELGLFINRLQERNFHTRAEATAYIDKSESKKMINDQIEALEQIDPTAADALRRSMKVLLANTLGGIDRGGKVKITDTGQQMVSFGNALFPKWEHKTKVKPQRQVTLSFDPVAGQAVAAGELIGDICLVINEKGESKKVRLFEGFPDESNYRFGLRSIGGKNMAPSYVKAAQYNEIRTQYMEWMKGENSTIKHEYDAHVAKLRIHFEKQPKFKSTDQKATWWKSAEGIEWQRDQQPLVNEWIGFLQNNPIQIFKQIDAVRSAPETKNGNGIGNVPVWRNHWTRDPDTETYLEQMAIEAKGQLQRQEGMINLEGHAGTGKDVALEMFCAETNRPLFATDCSKWTTEPELISDITLQVKDGASYVVDVPSSVLLGIQTPGAVVYFNEWNSMPLPSQILLHSLLSEKRAITLKLKSGKVVKVDPTVLIVGSQNPDYPGTFDPQMATVSRIVTLRRRYPPLYIEKDGRGGKRIYNYSEALRMARDVDSLANLTDDPNMDENEFVQLWNSYINGQPTGAAKPTAEQAYDMEVLLGIQFYANNLRQEFTKIIEKSADQYSALPINLPITGRELRRCATFLSEMTQEERAKSKPDETVRSLLERYYLNHFHKETEREQIKKAWIGAGWNYARLEPDKPKAKK